ncbi:hypothetical protein IWW35_000207 [Coemansia sp. RSA 1878]|nr:hypothetical protein IWW35_000207 [Coemansia sp. RSA 1878]
MDPVHSTRTVLCPADNAVMPRCAVHFYFHNPDQQAGFMEFGILRNTFIQTLRTSLPLALATRMQMTAFTYGGLTASIVDDPPLPPISKHTDDTRTVRRMIDADFAPSTQPRVIFGFPIQCNPLVGDPLVTLDVVYMADGVGIGLTFSHAVTDMGGVVRFCVEWSRVARFHYTKSATEHKPCVLNNDRSWFWPCICAEPSPPTPPFVTHLEALATATDTCAYADSSKHSNELFESAETDSNAEPRAARSPIYRMSISAHGVAHIGSVRDAVCPGVSIPNLISAALWQCISVSSPHPTTYFAASLTARTHPTYADYWGNTSTMKYMHHETHQVSRMPCAELARVIQQNVVSFTPAEFAYIINQYTSESYLQKLQRFVENDKAPRVMVSNMSRLPFYETDFGFGRPAKVCCPLDVPHGMAAFFPRSRSGGIDIYLRVSDLVVQNVVNHELLKDHITVIVYE